MVNPTTELEVARPRRVKGGSDNGKDTANALFLRGHRRLEARAARYPRDRRAAVAIPGGLRVPGDRPAQGRPAPRPARLRQDADRPRGGARDRRQVLHRQRARDHPQGSTGRASAHLRKIFEEAAKAVRRASSSSTRSTRSRPEGERVVGDVEKRVVAQLLAPPGRPRSPPQRDRPGGDQPSHALDPVLRRPGRFDREISISIPDRDGERRSSRSTAAGCRWRATSTWRTSPRSRTASSVPTSRPSAARPRCSACGGCCRRSTSPRARSPTRRCGLEVRMADFEAALCEVEPSAIPARSSFRAPRRGLATTSVAWTRSSNG